MLHPVGLPPVQFAANIWCGKIMDKTPEAQRSATDKAEIALRALGWGDQEVTTFRDHVRE